jgi:thioredoxin-like negative regulator of GroEL
MAAKYGVSQIPTVVIFKNGRVQGEPIVGAQDKQTYTSRLDALLQ